MELIVCTGNRWTTWCVYLCMIAAFPILVTFKQQYKRLAADKAHKLTVTNTEGSSEATLST